MAHEGQSQHLEQIMFLLVHGIEIGADDAEILGTFEGTKAAGYFLLYFGHPDGALAQIFGKRHTQVCDETQHLCGMLTHAGQQIERRRLFHPPPAHILSDGKRVVGMSIAENNLVMRKEPPYLPCAQRRAVLLSCRLAALTSAGQQPDHAFGPDLVDGFMQKRHFTQQVCIAQSVLPIQLPARLPAVIDQRRYALGQDAVRNDGEHAVIGLPPIPSECVARHRVQPMQAREIR